MKRSFLFFLAGITLCAFFLTGCVSEDTLSSSDLTLEELEKKMDQSTDPDGVLAGGKSCFLRQEVSTPMLLDEPVTRLVETKMLFPDKFQITTFEENEPLQTISSDGVHGWVADYSSRRISMLEGKTLRQTLAMTRLSGSSGHYSDFFPEAKINRCVNGDGTFYLVTCRGKEGGKFKFYVDASTFLLKRYVADFPVGSSSVDYDSRILSYSRFSGVMIPRETETTINGQKQRARVIVYQLNAPVKTEDFVPPVF